MPHLFIHTSQNREEAAAAGLAAGNNASVADQASWQIQLSLDQQAHGGNVPPAGSYIGKFTTPEGVCNFSYLSYCICDDCFCSCLRQCFSNVHLTRPLIA